MCHFTDEILVGCIITMQNIKILFPFVMYVPMLKPFLLPIIFVNTWSLFMNK